ncbi:ER membrane protein complex subunit 7-like [Pomacea canaliculata]|uniref:ER membrane protein complex subunit 7-like n=1 Tax=Pomacea canaliculata TaxID=400727 RepID=UPI000D73A14E|nr:ER membrane protein complex subunit 7-like [Pomacea canaliculata]
MEENVMQQFFHFVLCFFVFNLQQFGNTTEIVDTSDESNFKIEGRIYVSSSKDKDWVSNTRVLVDGGKYRGFIRNDGSFSVDGLPSGSFLVEVANPTYLFENLRVDITSKGKIRARKVSLLQPTKLQTVQYPLEFRERGKASYFQQREQWRLTDFLFNPMVLTMVLPLLLIMVLPKMMNAADPETRKEMQQQMNVLNSKPNMPDMSEMITNFFSGGKKPVKAKSSSKRK